MPCKSCIDDTLRCCIFWMGSYRKSGRSLCVQLSGACMMGICCLRSACPGCSLPWWGLRAENRSEAGGAGCSPRFGRLWWRDWSTTSFWTIDFPWLCLVSRVSPISGISASCSSSETFSSTSVSEWWFCYPSWRINSHRFRQSNAFS